ncbi:MAG: ATP-dependent DNA helicase RecG [Candidatus Hydrogenedentes bacterium]|nr:ATP-dependent DNA helicase RecG [Candidatus Hydrogenedentota bacterium]
MPVESNARPGLGEPVESLPGIGPKRAELLAALGIRTVFDLLFYFPRDYQDRRAITPISELREGETATIQAEFVKARSIRLRGRNSLAEATLRDGSGEIKATWFGRGFLAKTFTPGTRGLFTGPVGKYGGPALKNPDYELLSGDEEDRLHTGRIVPIYRLTEGVSQRMLRRWVHTALERAFSESRGIATTGENSPPDSPAAEETPLDETLPAALRLRYGYPEINGAIRCAHFPEEVERAYQARDRFAYEELLGMQLGVLRARAARYHEATGLRHVTGGPVLKTFRKSLPFRLTSAQELAVSDVMSDLASARPMMRMLQGDVGCGKTIVALHAVAACGDSGYQTALMAPTEILAEQHYLGLREILLPLGIEVELLTAATTNAAARKRVHTGSCAVVVGTHALFQEKTEFHKLGLVIIDEQHRFGVLQRSALVEKGANPDVLHMTATPIPRTLAITLYGGMDITVIDELPPGRLPVITRWIPPAKQEGLYQYLCQQAERGLQTYFVCPLIEESDSRELTALTAHYAALSAGPLASLRTAMLHGRLPNEEKAQIMHRFKTGEIDVLFSTSVIEVGMDVPSATTMVIEDAAQFGLTQLHQLRGRVGRGTEQSYCFLLEKPKTPEGKRRIEILCNTCNGFEIAEEDLKLRGPGEFQGIRQAGLSDLRVADLLRDVRLLDHARRDAEEILRKDPDLSGNEYGTLARHARTFAALNP